MIRPLPRLLGFILGFAVATLSSAGAAEKAQPPASPWTIDFRYAPPWWQTSICLPDDWQKTLVGREGQLLYDFPGKNSGFRTRLTFGLEGSTEWVRQELLAPRVPIVRTVKRQADVELTEEAFAVAPPLERKTEEKPAAVTVERVDGEGRDLNWATPEVRCDPAFRHIAVGQNRSIVYRVRPPAAAPCTIVLGLCEGWWKEPGKRPLMLRVEGAEPQRVDPIGELGRNMPGVFAFPARDADGDGWITVTVAAVPGEADQNTILNVLWVYGREAPPSDQILAGMANRRALAYVACGSPGPAGPPRHDVLLARLRNTGAAPATVAPTLTIDSEMSFSADAPHQQVALAGNRTLVFTQAFTVADQSKGRAVLRFAPRPIAPGKEESLAVGVISGEGAAAAPASVEEAESFRARAETYWTGLDLPYGVLQVPDAGVQALVDSSIRNIYQAREIKKGLPAFQVGPTCYRGLWVVDGSFLMEAVALLGREKEARSGIQYLLSFQRDDGAVMIMDGHWKETGIALWAVTHHARLTGDRAWLTEVWPQVERAFAYVGKMRSEAAPDPKAPNYRLIPEGFSDGGLGGRYPEYTNVYWTLVGLKSAVDAADWLGKKDEAAKWRAEYDDFLATFRRAAQRDMRTDAHGNRYLPIRMRDDQNVAPQKAHWGFLHAVYPGEVFPPGDPLVTGNMAMLRANECEGLVYGTGWINEGVWNYFGSFYAHAWLWLGQGSKAAETLYAFGNHASPLLCWREEQSPVGKGHAVCGDMPHNWASAEFIRLVRHLLILQRGDELHLLEGLPPTWIKPGAVTRVTGALTEFGPMGLELRVGADGRTASLHVDPPRRDPPRKIVVHLAGWSGGEGTLELPADGPSDREIPIGPGPR